MGPLVPDKVGQVLIVLDSTYNTQIIILLNEYGSYMEKTAANTKMKFSFHFVLVLAMLRLFVAGFYVLGTMPPASRLDL